MLTSSLSSQPEKDWDRKLVMSFRGQTELQGEYHGPGLYSKICLINYRSSLVPLTQGHVLSVGGLCPVVLTVHTPMSIAVPK